MNFTYCDKNLINLDFEADDCFSQDEIFEFWDMIDIDTKDVPVFEVNVVKDDDEIQMYIYITNNDEFEMLDCTFKAVQTLKNREFDAFVSDEDYGGLDVIIVNLTPEHLQIARDIIYQRSLRTCPECGKTMAYAVSGTCAFGEEVHQFHCQNCHYTWVGHPNGEFIREGVLLSRYEVEQMWGH